MPRRNHHIRFDKSGRQGQQKGKGRKRARDFHRSTHLGAAAAADHLPDVGSGADPTTAAPLRVRRGNQTLRGSALS